MTKSVVIPLTKNCLLFKIIVFYYDYNEFWEAFISPESELHSSPGKIFSCIVFEPELFMPQYFKKKHKKSKLIMLNLWRQKC